MRTVTALAGHALAVSGDRGACSLVEVGTYQLVGPGCHPLREPAARHHQLGTVCRAAACARAGARESGGDGDGWREESKERCGRPGCCSRCC